MPYISGLLISINAKQVSIAQSEFGDLAMKAKAQSKSKAEELPNRDSAVFILSKSGATGSGSTAAHS
jgi:hypothetical protein